MKNIILFLLFFFAFAASATAQRTFEEYHKTDSLVNQDTVIQLMTWQFKNPFYYSIQIQADSISGANAGTALLQFSNQSTPTRWVTAQTLTIDGTGSDSAIYEGILYARRVRLYFISPSGTRRVNLYTDASFKMLK